MPQCLSRITLEITKVRVERLQEISNNDCEAEGLNRDGPLESGNLRPEFAELWDSLHSKGAWEQNPWVWVIEFKRL